MAQTIEEKRALLKRLRLEAKRKKVQELRGELAEEKEDIGAGEAGFLSTVKGMTFDLSSKFPEVFAQLGAADIAASPLSGDVDLRRQALEGLSPEETEQLRQTTAIKEVAAKEKFPVLTGVAETAGGLATSVGLAAPVVAGTAAPRIAFGAAEGFARAAIRGDNLATGTAIGAGTGAGAELLGAALRGTSRLFKAASRGMAGKKSKDIAMDAAEKIAINRKKMASGELDITEGAIKNASIQAQADAAIKEAATKSGHMSGLRGFLKPASNQDLAKAGVAMALGGPKAAAVQMVRQRAGRALISEAERGAGSVAQGLATVSAPAVAASPANPMGSESLFNSIPGGP